MRAQLIKSSPGAGKTTAVASAIARWRASARIVTGSLRLARELAAEHGYALVEGRHPGNCQRHDVVRALGTGGHDVEALACGRADKPRCPFRNDCSYFQQFEAHGPRVGTSEQLFNRNFLAGGGVVVVDDADLKRALIERVFLSKEDLGRTCNLLRGKSRLLQRQILTVLGHAALDLATFENGASRHLLGALAWDHLARTAQLYGHQIEHLVSGLPKRVTLPKPEPDEQGIISTQAIDDVPPANLQLLFSALRDELPAFLSGEEFNSRIRLSRDGVEVWYLKDHIRSRSGEALLPQMDLLVLDATPIPTLVDYLTRDHERLPDVEVRIRMPENVRVVQYASSTNGHTVLGQEEKAKQVQSEIAAERSRFPTSVSREGAACFRSMRQSLINEGFLESQVVTFGSVRGTNALAEVERLHLVGRPMPPGGDLVYLAQVLHFAERPVSDRIVLKSRAFAGQSYEVDVVDYTDERVAELLKAEREDEMEQAIHRARLFTLEQPSLALGDSKESRHYLRVVLHTNHPLPGLRVDELITRTESVQVNEQRHNDAQSRIRKAVLQLQEMCRPVTAVAVAGLAGASRRTVAEYLRNSDHTLKRGSSYKGVITFPQETDLPGARPDEGQGPAADPLLCLGGCGKPMPQAGQRCFECATASTVAWRESTGRRGKP